MSAQLYSAKKLLIMPKRSMQLAEYLAFTVLLESLRKSIPEVHICMNGKFDPALTGKVSLPEVKILSKVPPRRFVLSFDKGSDQVKNIQWHQTGEKINLYISMQGGKFQADGMQVQTEGANYDVILYFGITNFQQIEPLISDFPAIVHETHNVSFGSTFAIPHGKVELVQAENGETTSELVYQHSKGKGTTPEHYTRILAGILLETKRFQNANTRARTFRTCSELMSNGANLASSNSLAQATTKPSTPKPVGGIPSAAKSKPISGKPTPVGKSGPAKRETPLPAAQPKKPDDSKPDTQRVATRL